MKNTVLLILLGFILFSCDKQKKLYDEVMVVHDTAMAKMDKMITLKSALKERSQTLSEDSSAENMDEIEKIDQLIANLNEADDSMMSWMREFHQNYEKQAKGEIMEYLEKQKNRITLVGEKINAAIKAAETYLNNTE